MKPGPLSMVVLGTGLIGTSVALAARAAGHQVALGDQNPEHLATAVAMGAGEPLSADAEVAGQVDLVVVAVPPSAAASVVASALAVYPRATVTDVASVKSPVVAALLELGAPVERFVPGHPMAGRETSGPRDASAELFRGRSWMLTPTEVSDRARTAAVAAFVRATGAIVRVMPIDEHDEAVALTSHAPQVVSSLMAARLAGADPELVTVAGQGLRDVVRIAGSDPVLWSDILTANAHQVTPVLAALRDDLDAVVSALNMPDSAVAPASETVLSSSAPPASSVLLEQRPGSKQGAAQDPRARIAEVIARGNLGARLLPAKHGGAAAEYVDVPVEVQDEPGSLGRVFLAAADAGINLEDVRIEHTVGRQTAIAHLYVVPGVAEDLSEALDQAGWLVLA